jgi:phosphodiesterase/alkaline phosphatase D-like protein
MTSGLRLGPLLRYVDSTSAAVWLHAATSGEVAVRLAGDDRRWTAPTFAVHGHHFALVELTDLRPGTAREYVVEIDGHQVWPEPDAVAPSVLRTLPADEQPSLAFGSCRTSVPHDAKGHLTHGVDALRTFAMAMAGEQIPMHRWPHCLLLLGDQVYADTVNDEMKEFIASRRSLDEPPGEELKDFDEYAELYRIAWSDPWIRWALSVLPSQMIFDDHDVRDDWNTSWQWRQDMERTSWWHGRIVAAMASYWVFQHVGNLSVQERAKDEIWSELQHRQAAGGGEVDLTDVLDAFGDRVDQKPDSYRWSYARDFGSARLVVVDSRAARVLEDGQRSMLDDEEMDWLDSQVRGDHSHLLIGTSLPFLLPAGLHHLEASSEAVAAGVWGDRAAGAAEKVRRGMDLEHWAAFQDAFRRVCAMAGEVADGGRGEPPRSIVFLSGDVHHSYIAEAAWHRDTRLLQFVCSPIRNPLPRPVRAANVVASHRLAGIVGRPLAAWAQVPPPPFSWDTVAGPWYDNNLALLLFDDDHLRVSWWTGSVAHADHERPRLSPVARMELRMSDGPARVMRRARRR